MPGYYLRYTLPYFYRKIQGGPLDSLTLMGQPNISGISTTQAVITRHRPEPGSDGHATYTWKLFHWYQGYPDCMGGILLESGGSSKVFDSQHAAALDADQYIGRHHHTSVLHDGPKPAESWIQKAIRLWQEWEKELKPEAVTH